MAIENKVDVKEGPALLVSKLGPGNYAVRVEDPRFDRTQEPYAFGYQPAEDWEALGIRNLDFQSDEYSCFGISRQVQAQGCSFGIDTIQAPNLQAIRTQARHLMVKTYPRGDI